jgi:UDP-N-acetylmuramyl pentapeptide phosphotransferase/UDP-N-acetylglucosamine-1-phosphate transferase
MFLCAVAAACLFASVIGVAIFVRVAAHARWLDVPNERSSHRVPTPRGAGLVIVLVVSAAMAWAASAGLYRVDATAVAALTIAVISAIDDVRSLPSGLRLLVHLGCALVAVLTIGGPGDRTWQLLMIVLAVVWIVGLTNAYNFMDGIDGISGAQAVVAGVAFALAALHVGLAGPAICGVAIAAASGGFLMHNWSPARVFMGDVGSAFLGFSFAVMALQIAAWSPAAGIAAALSLWPFIFDTTLTFLRRAVRGENVMQSHRSHLYQRLVIAGWSHASVTVLYAATAALGAAAGLAWALR